MRECEALGEIRIGHPSDEDYGGYNNIDEFCLSIFLLRWFMTFFLMNQLTMLLFYSCTQCIQTDVKVIVGRSMWWSSFCFNGGVGEW